ncbi:hypothetical protein GQ53DRAFT_661811 [Thozetella sp. PMI_491]|nr:hypothetical protein GQ53DRAFT_661811 [Thozetella sp. PMI_491]
MLKKIQKVATLPLGDHHHPPPPPLKDAPLPPVPSVTETGASPPTLKKTRGAQRSSSAELLPNDAKLQPNRLQTRRLSPSPSPDARGRSSSAQPPPSRAGPGDGVRNISTPGLAPPVDGGDASPANESRGRLRRSWLPGGRSRSGSVDLGKGKSGGIWVMSPGGTAEYSAAVLTNGDKVPELWNENGLVCVYLHPKSAGLGPSFKVADQIFSDSRALNELLLNEAIARSEHSRPGSGSDGPSEGHLYLPLSGTDLESLVAGRNLFAFLTGQPLVCTNAHPTIFSAFLEIAKLLQQWGFSSYDGSSFGGTVEARFESCIDQFNLADVRHSREKTLEALVLGEHMRSWTLYNEGFAHAVGKYDDLFDLKSPLFGAITASTRSRMERAHLDLVNRQAGANNRLEAFEFPSLFAGIAASTSTEEYRNVRFKEWRNSFLKMRSFVLGYYKDLFGNWPPKARSKRNSFSQSGLNRVCLKMLYSDLCALYDLLADRESLTPRVIDQQQPEEDLGGGHVDPMISALRKMLSEFDHSSPPVLPPVPYDVPKLPTMTAIREDYNQLPAKKQAKFDKGLAANELLLILIKSHNIDTDALQMPFLAAFKDFELKEAKGVLPHDMADQRVGYWLFLYVVLQSLPMLVVDAPGLHHTEGVEYFLCEPPQGNLPWMDDAGEVRKIWYQTAGQGIVELSADVVMFSVEATYMRSHCWLAAKEWEAAKASATGTPTSAQTPGSRVVSGATVPPGLEPLEPPRNVFQDMDPFSSPSGHSSHGSPTGSPQLLPVRGRNSSPAGRSSAMANHFHRSSVAMGLEPLPFPEGGSPGERRVVSSRPGSSAGLLQQQQGHHRLGSRSRSVGNLAQLAGYGQGEELPPVPPIQSGHKHSDSTGGASTFDDILKGMDQEKSKSKKRFGF